MIIKKTTFRTSTHLDEHAIARVHDRAFGRETEGELAVALRYGDNCKTLDLVAQLDDVLIGHVLLSEPAEGPERALVLGPLAVDPAWRDFQIGTELVRRALADARISGWRSVFVLGEPDYYRRFGFKRSLAEKVRCAYNVGPAFQALELETGSLNGFNGSLAYPAAFHAVD
ncbi:MAG: N-acetyltransferase [Pseudomonadota bacterium]